MRSDSGSTGSSNDLAVHLGLGSSYLGSPGREDQSGSGLLLGMAGAIAINERFSFGIVRMDTWLGLDDDQFEDSDSLDSSMIAVDLMLPYLQFRAGDDDLQIPIRVGPNLVVGRWDVDGPSTTRNERHLGLGVALEVEPTWRLLHGGGHSLSLTSYLGYGTGSGEASRQVDSVDESDSADYNRLAYGLGLRWEVGSGSLGLSYIHRSLMFDESSVTQESEFGFEGILISFAQVIGPPR